MNPFISLGIPVWGIARWFVFLGLVVYLVFSLVLVRQVQLMTRTLDVDFEKPIQILALFHLVFAIGVLVLAFIIL